MATGGAGGVGGFGGGGGGGGVGGSGGIGGTFGGTGGNSGGGGGGGGAAGGAIFVRFTGNLKLVSCTFQNNSVTAGQGGVGSTTGTNGTASTKDVYIMSSATAVVDTMDHVDIAGTGTIRLES